MQENSGGREEQPRPVILKQLCQMPGFFAWSLSLSSRLVAVMPENPPGLIDRGLTEEGEVYNLSLGRAIPPSCSPLFPTAVF